MRWWWRRSTGGWRCHLPRWPVLKWLGGVWRCGSPLVEFLSGMIASFSFGPRVEMWVGLWPDYAIFFKVFATLSLVGGLNDSFFFLRVTEVAESGPPV